MPVKHEFKYNNASIDLHQWINTLSISEQQTFKEAQDRQFATRQLHIDSGDLKVEIKDSIQYYVWKDEETERIGKKQDPIWMQYFNRYLSENNIQFEVVKTKL